MFWSCWSNGWWTGSNHCMYASVAPSIRPLESLHYQGPFELTKLSAQISVLMANRNKSSVEDPIRASYQQKGTLSTAKNIILHRGVMGLYSGFGLHFRTHASPMSLRGTLTGRAAVRDTIGTAIYFTTYESGKQLLVKFQGSNSPTSPLSVAMAGGLCGLVSWACVCSFLFLSRRLGWMLMSLADRYTPSTRPKPITNAIASPRPKVNLSKSPASNSTRRPCIEVSAFQWQGLASSIPFSFRVSNR